MIRERLESFVRERRCTLLGVGPVSMNCVDAAIEVANQHDVPIILIASRRQIDSEDFGGGYVNNWNTGQFARYVSDRDRRGRVVLARDHGGPWQNSREIELGLNLRQAMDSAKRSYLSDLNAGFQILHIDPSIDMHDVPDIDETLERIFELYEYCWAQAVRLDKDVIFEIGTEEQTGTTNTQEELEYTLHATQQFCIKNNLPLPSFVVVQTGTRVMEMRNVGSFDSPIRIVDELPAEIQLPKVIEICDRYGILMKEHNADYLSDETLQWHPRLGIHSANVAPEFGVTETRALLSVLEHNDMTDLADCFLQLALDSGKWGKWMLAESEATDRDRAIIAGHYVFSSPECIRLKEMAGRLLMGKGIELERLLKATVKQSILRYLCNFRSVRAA